MTPQRQAYFNKCSKQEKLIRRMLLEAECMIIVHKETLNKREYPFHRYSEEDIEYAFDCIRQAKIIANAYRHELAKIKGMDKVVYPHKIKINKGDYIVNLWRCSSCGDGLCEDDNYCSACGRKIMWERVKA